MALTSVRNFQQFVQATTRKSAASVVVIGVNAFKIARLQHSTPKLLAAIDECFADIDGEISYNLQTTMTSVSEFPDIREASRFLDELADAFRSNEPAGLTATLYHEGSVVERVEQCDENLITRIVQ